MTAFQATTDALLRAIAQHGSPNGFSSQWLSEVEGGVERKQANRAGRDYFRDGLTLTTPDGPCFVTYDRGLFEVQDLWARS